MEPMAASCYRNTLLTVSGVSTAVMDTGKYSPNGANVTEIHYSPCLGFLQQ